MLSGCREGRRHLPAKSESWPADRVAEAPYWRYQAQEKTAGFVSGVNITGVQRPSENRIHYLFDTPTHALSRAIILTADGYALTSDHGITSAGPHWAMFGDGLFAQCRIVWRSHKSNAKRSEPDWSIIKIDHSFSDACQWSGADPLVGESVIAAGYGVSLGVIEDIWRHSWENGAYMILGHSAPTEFGDSGGALLDQNAKLIGMLYAHEAEGWRSYAVRPDPVFVQNIIEADRHKQVGATFNGDR